jgi:hypothetical protein
VILPWRLLHLSYSKAERYKHWDSTAVRSINRAKLKQEKPFLSAGFQPEAEGHDDSAYERWDGCFGHSCRQQNGDKPGVNGMARKSVGARINEVMMLIAPDQSRPRCMRAHQVTNSPANIAIQSGAPPQGFMVHKGASPSIHADHGASMMPPAIRAAR